MFFSKLTAAAVLAATAVSAQINTPAALIQCQPIQISWVATTGPYYLSVIPGSQPGAAPLLDFGQVDSSPITWNVNITAGTSVGFALVDSTGTPKYSDAVTIRAGSSDSCLNSASGAGAAAAPAGSASSAAASASSGAAGVVESATSAAASMVQSASSAAGAATSRAASAANSATSAAGSMASSAANRVSQSASGAAAASSTPANGASKVESAGLMAAALAVVVAAAL